MRMFSVLVIYVMIGGMFTVISNNDYIDRCNDYLDNSTAAYITFGWPAIMPIALLVDKPENHEFECSND